MILINIDFLIGNDNQLVETSQTREAQSVLTPKIEKSISPEQNIKGKLIMKAVQSGALQARNSHGDVIIGGYA